MADYYCAECDKTVKKPRTGEGKKPRCPSCGTALQSREKDDDDESADSRPGKKGRGEAKPKRSNAGLIIGLAVGGGVLLLGVVAVVVVVVVFGMAAGRRLANGPGGAGGPKDLKAALVGKWISSLSIQAKAKPGTEAYIQFDDKGTYQGNLVGLEAGGYRVLDGSSIEMTHRADGGIPAGARTTVVPDLIENGKLVRRGHTLVHEKYTVRMSAPDKLEMKSQGPMGMSMFFEREVPKKEGGEKRAGE